MAREDAHRYSSSLTTSKLIAMEKTYRILLQQSENTMAIGFTIEVSVCEYNNYYNCIENRAISTTAIINIKP